MSTSSDLSKSPHDLHIEITEDTVGSLKVRPSSVASSHGGDDFIDSRSGTFDHRWNSVEELVNGSGNNDAFVESAEHSEGSDDTGNDYDYVVIDFLNDSKAKIKTPRHDRDVSGPVLILRRQNSRHFPREATVTTSMIIFLTKKRRARSDVPKDVDIWRRYCNFIVFYAWREPRIIFQRTIWWYYICPYSIIIVFVHPSRAIQIIEYEREHHTKPIKPEESYRIYIDRNDSRESLLDDDINHEFNQSYPVSDDGYQISFIDEEENVEVRKLTLSADFSRSYESKSYCERCDTSSEYSLDFLDEKEEDNHSTNMEQSLEYSIEFREENVNKPKKRRKKTPRKIPKIKTDSVSTEDIDLEFHSTFDESKERPHKGFELIFTNESEPHLKSKLTLSADLSKSHEELLTNDEPENIDEEDEKPMQREDYYIVQMYTEQNGKPADGKTSTPRKGILRKPKREEFIDQELVYEIRPDEQQQQESTPEPLFVDDNVPEVIKDAEPKSRHDDGNLSPKRITVFDERQQDEGPSTNPAEGDGVMKRMSKENVFSFQKEFLKILRVPTSKKQEEKAREKENEMPVVDKRVEESNRDYTVKKVELDHVDMSHPPEENEATNEPTEPDEDDQPEENDTLPCNLDTEEELTKRLTRVYRKKNLNTKKDDNANELKDILSNYPPEQRYQVFTVSEERVQKPKTKSLSDTFKGLFGKPSKNQNIAEPLDQREPEVNKNEISAIILEPVKHDDEDDSPVFENDNFDRSHLAPVIVEEDDIVEDMELRHVESEINFEDFISEDENEEHPCVDKDHEEKEQATIPEEQPKAPSDIVEDSIEPEKITEKVDVKPASKKGPTLLSLVLGRKVNEQPDENDLVFPKETRKDLEPDETTEIPVRVAQVYRNKCDEPVTDKDELTGLFDNDLPNKYNIQQAKEEEPPRARSISGKVKSGLRRIFSGPEKQPAEQSQPEQSQPDHDEEQVGHHLDPIQLSTVDENIDEEQEDVQPTEIPWKDRSEEDLVDETMDCIAVENNPPFDFIFDDSEDETKEKIGLSETGQSDEDTVEQEDRRVVKVYREKPLDDGKSINDEFICTNDEAPCTNEDLPHTTDKTLPQKFALGFKRIFSGGPKERSNIEPDIETAIKDANIEEEDVPEESEEDSEPENENEDDVSPGYTVQDFDDAQIAPSSSLEPTFQTLCTEVVPKRAVYRQTTLPKENEEERDMADLKDSQATSPFTVEIVKEETLPPRYETSLSGRIKGSIRKIFRSKEDLTAPEEHEEESDNEEVSDIQALRLEPIDIVHSGDEHDDSPVQFEAIQIDVTLNTIPIDEDVIAEEMDKGVVETADLDFSPFERSESENSDAENTKEGGINNLAIGNEDPNTFETVPKRIVYREMELPKENKEEQEIAQLKYDEPLSPFTVEIVREEKVPPEYGRSLSGRIKGSIRRIFKSKEDLTSSEEPVEEETEDETSDIQPLSLEPINIGDGESDSEQDPTESAQINVTIKLTEIDEDVIAEEIDTGVVETVDVDMSQFEPLDNETSDSESSNEEESDKLAIKDEEPITFETFSAEVVPKRVAYRQTILPKDHEEEQELDELKHSEQNEPFNIEVLAVETVPPTYDRSLSGRIKGSIRKIFRSKEDLTGPEEHQKNDDEEEVSDIKPLCLEPIDVGDSESDGEEDSRESTQINVTIKLTEIDEEVVVEEVDTGVVETVDVDISQFEPSDNDTSVSNNSDEEERDKLAVKDEEPVTSETFSAEVVPQRVVYRQTTLPKVNQEEQELDELKDSEPNTPFNIEVIPEENVPPKYDRSLSGRIKGSIRKMFRSKEDLTSPEEHQENDDEEEISDIKPLCLEPIDVGDSESDGEEDPRESTQINVTIKLTEIDEDVIAEEVDTGVVETVDVDMSQFEPSDNETIDRENSDEEESDKLAVKDEEPVTFEKFSAEVVPKRVVYRQTIIPKENEEEQGLDELNDSGPNTPFNIEVLPEETVPPKYDRSLSGRIKGSIRKIFRSKEDLTSPEEHQEDDEREISDIKPLCLEPIDVGDSESDGEQHPTESAQINVTVNLSEIDEDVIAEEIDTGVVETVDVDMSQFEPSDNETSDNENSDEEENDKAAIKDEEPVTFETFSAEVVPKRVVYRQTIIPKENEEEQELDELKDSEPDTAFNIEVLPEETVPPKYDRSLSGRIKGSIRKIFRSKEDLTAPEEHQENDDEEEISDIKPLCLEPIDVGDSESDGEEDPRESTQINVTIKLTEIDEEVVVEEVDTGVVETVDVDISQFEPSDNDTSVSNNSDEEERDKLAVKDEEPVTSETFSAEVVPQRVVYRQTTLPKVNQEEQELDELKDSEPNTPFNIEVIPEENVPPKYDRSLSGRIKGSIRKIFRSKEDLTSPEEHQENDDEEEISDIKPLCLEPIDVGDSESDGEEDPRESTQINVTIKLTEIDEDVIAEEVDTGVVETVDVDMSQFEPSDNETIDRENSDEKESDKLAVKDEEPVTFEKFSAEVVPKRVVYRQTIITKENEEEQGLDELNDSGPHTPFNIEVLPEETVPPKYDRSLSGRIKGSIRKIFRSKEDLTSPEEHQEDDEREISDIKPLCLEPIDVGDSESDGEQHPTKSAQINVTVNLSEIDEDVIAEEIDTGVVETVDVDMSQFEPSDNETSDNENSDEEENDKAAIKDEEPVTFETFSAEVVPKRVVYRQTIIPKENEEEQELDELKDSEPDTAFNIEVLPEETVPPKYDRSLSGRIKGSIRKIFRSKEDLTAPEEHQENDDEEEISDIKPLCLEPIDVGDSESDGEEDLTELAQINVTIKLSEINEDVVVEEIDTGVVETVDVDISQFEPSDNDTSVSNNSDEEERDKLAVKDEEPVTSETFSAEVVPQRVVYRQTTLPKVNQEEQELDELKDSEPNTPFNIEVIPEEIVPPKYDKSLSGRIKGSIRKIFRSKEDLTSPEEHQEDDDEEEISDIKPLCLEPIDVGDSESDGEEDPRESTQINVTIKLTEIDEDVIAEEIDTGVVETVDVDMSQFEPSDNETSDSDNSDEEESDKIAVKDEEPVTFETFSAEVVPRRIVYRQTTLPKTNEEDQELDELKESEPNTPFNIEVITEENVPPKYDRSLSGRIKGSIRKIFRSKEDLTAPEEHQEDDDEEEISDIKPLCLEPIDIGDSESDGEEDTRESTQINVTIKLSEIDEDVIAEEIDTGVMETVDVDMSQFEPSDNETSDSDNSDEEESDKLAVKDEEPLTFETFASEVVPRRVVYRETTLPKANEEEQELDELKGSEPDTAFNIEVLPEETVSPKYDRSLSGRIKGSIRKIFRSKEDLTSPEEPDEGTGDEISDIQPLCLEPINIGDTESDEELVQTEAPQINLTINLSEIDEGVIAEEIDTGVVETVDVDMSQFERSDNETSDRENSNEEESDKLAVKDEEPVTFETFSAEVVPRRVVYRETILPKDNEEEQELDELKHSESNTPFNVEVIPEETVPPKYDRSLSGRIKGSIRKIFRSKEDLTAPEEHQEDDDEEEISDIKSLCLEPIDIGDSESDGEEDPTDSTLINATIKLPEIDEDTVVEEVDTGVVETVDVDMSQFEPSNNKTSDRENSDEEESNKLALKDEEPVTFETFASEVVPKRVVYRQTILPKDNEEEQELDELKHSEPNTPFNVEVIPEATVPPKYDKSLSGRIKGSIRKIFRSKEELTSPEEHQEDDDEEEISDIKPLCLEPIDVGDSESDGEEDPRESTQINVTIKLTEIDEDVIAEEIDTGVVETVDVDMSQFEPSDNETSDSDNSDEEESDKIAVKDEEPVTFETFSAEVVPRRVVYRQTTLPKATEEDQELDELKESEPNTPFNIEVITEDNVPPKYDRSLSGRIKGSIRKIFRSKEDLTAPEEHQEDDDEEEISDIKPLFLEPIDIGDSESDGEEDTRESTQINVTIKLSEIDEDVIAEEIDTGVMETVDVDMSQFEPSDNETSDSDNSDEEESDKLAVKDEEPLTLETFASEVVPRRVVYRETTLPKANEEEQELDELKGSEPDTAFNIEVLPEETVSPKYDRSLSGRIKGSIRKIFRSKEDLTSPEEPDEGTGDEISDIQPLCLEPINIGDTESDEELVQTEAPQINLTINLSEIDEGVIAEEIDTGVVETVDVDMNQFERSDNETSDRENSNEEESDKLAVKDEEPVTFETFSAEVVPRRVVYRETILPKDNEEEQELDELKHSEPNTPFNVEVIPEATVPPKYDKSLSGRIKGSIRKIFRSKEELTSPEEHQEDDDEEEISDIKPLCLEPIDVGDSESDGEEDPRESTQINVTIKLTEIDEDVIAEEIDTGVVETVDVDMSQFEPSDNETSDSDNSDEEESDKIAVKDEEPVTFETFSAEVVPRRVVYRQTTLPKANEEDQELDELKESEPNTPFNIEVITEDNVPPKYDRSLSGRIKGSIRKIFRSKEDLTAPEEHQEDDDEEEISDIKPLFLEPIDIGDSESDGEEDTRESTQINVTIKLSEIDEDVIAEEIDTGVMETVDVDMSQFEPSDNETSDSDNSDEEESDKLAVKDEEPLTLETFASEVVPRRVVYRETTLPKANEEEQELDELKGSEPDTAFNIEVLPEETVSPKYDRSLSGRIKGSIRKIFRSKEDLTSPEEPDEGTGDEISDIQPLCLEPINIGDTESDEELVQTEAPQINLTINLSEIDEGVIAEEIDTGVVETVDVDMSQFERSDNETSDRENSNEEESDKLAVKDEEPVTFETFSAEVVPRRVVYRETILPKDNEEEQKLDELKHSESNTPFNVEVIPEETVPPKYDRSLSGRIKGSIRKIFRSKEDLTAPEEHQEDDDEEEISDIKPLCLVPIDIGDSESDGEEDTRESTQINVTIKLSEIDEDVIAEEIDTGVVETVDVDMSQYKPSDNETSDSDNSDEEESDKVAVKDEEPLTFETFASEVVPRRVVYRETILPKDNEEEQELDELKHSESNTPFNVEVIPEETVPPKYDRSLSGRIKSSIRKIFRSKEDLAAQEEDQECTDQEDVSDIQPLCLEPINIGDIEFDEEPQPIDTIRVNVTIKNIPIDEDFVVEEVDTAVVETVDIDISQFESSESETSDTENFEEGDDGKLAMNDEEPVTFETFSTEVVPKRVVYRETKLDNGEEVRELDELKEDERVPFNIVVLDEEHVPPKYDPSLPGRIKGSILQIFRSKEDLTTPDELPEHDTGEEVCDIQPLHLEPVDFTHSGDSMDGETGPFKSVQVDIAVSPEPFDEDIITEEVETGVVETVEFDFDQMSDDKSEADAIVTDVHPTCSDHSSSESSEEEEEPTQDQETAPVHDIFDNPEPEEPEADEIPQEEERWVTAVYRIKDEGHDDEDLKGLMDSRASEPVFHKPNKEQLSKPVGRYHPKRMRSTIIGFFDISPKNDKRDEPDSPELETGFYEITPLCLEPMDTDRVPDEPEEFEGAPVAAVCDRDGTVSDEEPITEVHAISPPENEIDFDVMFESDESSDEADSQEGNRPEIDQNFILEIQEKDLVPDVDFEAAPLEAEIDEGIVEEKDELEEPEVTYEVESVPVNILESIKEAPEEEEEMKYAIEVKPYDIEQLQIPEIVIDLAEDDADSPSSSPDSDSEIQEDEEVKNEINEPDETEEPRYFIEYSMAGIKAESDQSEKEGSDLEGSIADVLPVSKDEQPDDGTSSSSSESYQSEKAEEPEDIAADALSAAQEEDLHDDISPSSSESEHSEKQEETDLHILAAPISEEDVHSDTASSSSEQSQHDEIVMGDFDEPAKHELETPPAEEPVKFEVDIINFEMPLVVEIREHSIETNEDKEICSSAQSDDEDFDQVPVVEEEISLPVADNDVESAVLCEDVQEDDNNRLGSSESITEIEECLPNSVEEIEFELVESSYSVNPENVIIEEDKQTREELDTIEEAVVAAVEISPVEEAKVYVVETVARDLVVEQVYPAEVEDTEAQNWPVDEEDSHSESDESEASSSDTITECNDVEVAQEGMTVECEVNDINDYKKMENISLSLGISDQDKKDETKELHVKFQLRFDDVPSSKATLTVLDKDEDVIVEESINEATVADEKDITGDDIVEKARDESQYVIDNEAITEKAAELIMEEVPEEDDTQERSENSPVMLTSTPYVKKHQESPIINDNSLSRISDISVISPPGNDGPPVVHIASLIVESKPVIVQHSSMIISVEDSSCKDHSLTKKDEMGKEMMSRPKEEITEEILSKAEKKALLHSELLFKTAAIGDEEQGKNLSASEKATREYMRTKTAELDKELAEVKSSRAKQNVTKLRSVVQVKEQARMKEKESELSMIRRMRENSLKALENEKKRKVKRYKSVESELQNVIEIRRSLSWSPTKLTRHQSAPHGINIMGDYDKRTLSSSVEQELAEIKKVRLVSREFIDDVFGDDSEIQSKRRADVEKELAMVHQIRISQNFDENNNTADSQKKHDLEAELEMVKESRQSIDSDIEDSIVKYWERKQDELDRELESVRQSRLSMSRDETQNAADKLDEKNGELEDELEMVRKSRETIDDVDTGSSIEKYWEMRRVENANDFEIVRQSRLSVSLGNLDDINEGNEAGKLELDIELDMVRRSRGDAASQEIDDSIVEAWEKRKEEIDEELEMVRRSRSETAYIPPRFTDNSREEFLKEVEELRDLRERGESFIDQCMERLALEEARRAEMDEELERVKLVRQNSVFEPELRDVQHEIETEEELHGVRRLRRTKSLGSLPSITGDGLDDKRRKAWVFGGVNVLPFREVSIDIDELEKSKATRKKKSTMKFSNV